MFSTLHFTVSFFFFNDTATTEIYTLSLHDALPISRELGPPPPRAHPQFAPSRSRGRPGRASGSRRAIRDRKSTRLNSSHGYISYAVFCLKKKKKPSMTTRPTTSTTTHFTSRTCALI